MEGLRILSGYLHCKNLTRTPSGMRFYVEKYISMPDLFQHYSQRRHLKALKTGRGLGGLERLTLPM